MFSICDPYQIGFEPHPQNNKKQITLELVSFINDEGQF
jgi:hypothetical protein